MRGGGNASQLNDVGCYPARCPVAVFSIKVFCNPWISSLGEREKTCWQGGTPRREQNKGSFCFLGTWAYSGFIWSVGRHPGYEPVAFWAKYEENFRAIAESSRLDKEPLTVTSTPRRLNLVLELSSGYGYCLVVWGNGRPGEL